MSENALFVELVVSDTQSGEPFGAVPHITGRSLAVGVVISWRVETFIELAETRAETTLDSSPGAGIETNESKTRSKTIAITAN